MFVLPWLMLLTDSDFKLILKLYKDLQSQTSVYVYKICKIILDVKISESQPTYILFP